MKVILTESFFKSLRTYARHSTWWYQIYETVFRDVPRFLKNIYLFRKALYHYRVYDYVGSLCLLQRGINLTGTYINKYGIAIDEHRFASVRAIRRAEELLKNHIEDNFLERIEEKTGKKFEIKIFTEPGKYPEEETDRITTGNHGLSLMAHQLMLDEWEELWGIISGKDGVEGTGIWRWWD